MSRFNIALVALAALQILLLVVAGDSTEESAKAPPGVGREPFAGLKQDEVQTLEITDDDLRTVVLKRAPKPELKQDGNAEKDGKKDDTAEQKDAWLLASTDDFPVRDGEVGRSLDSLAKLRLARLLTRQTKNFTSLDISDSSFSRHIVVKGKDGRLLGDFYIGDSSRPNSVHYREAGKDIAYEAMGISTWDFNADASGWIESSFTELESKDVVALAIQNKDDSFEIRLEQPAAASKDGDQKTDPDAKPSSQPTGGEAQAGDKSAQEKTPAEKAWVVVAPAQKVGQSLDKTKVESLLSSLCRLYLASPIGRRDRAKDAELGFDKPTATATLTMKDGSTQVITVGSKREKEDDFYATRTGFDYVVTLRPWSVNEQLGKKLSDLEPEKTTEGGGDKK